VQQVRLDTILERVSSRNNIFVPAAECVVTMMFCSLSITISCGILKAYFYMLSFFSRQFNFADASCIGAVAVVANDERIVRGHYCVVWTLQVGLKRDSLYALTIELNNSTLPVHDRPCLPCTSAAGRVSVSLSATSFPSDVTDNR